MRSLLLPHLHRGHQEECTGSLYQQVTQLGSLIYEVDDDVLGVWLQQDGGWGKHVKETCKKAYMRMGFLSKLKYAGIDRKELVHNY